MALDLRQKPFFMLLDKLLALDKKVREKLAELWKKGEKVNMVDSSTIDVVLFSRCFKK